MKVSSNPWISTDQDALFTGLAYITDKRISSPQSPGLRRKHLCAFPQHMTGDRGVRRACLYSCQYQRSILLAATVVRATRLPSRCRCMDGWRCGGLRDTVTIFVSGISHCQCQWHSICGQDGTGSSNLSQRPIHQGIQRLPEQVSAERAGPVVCGPAVDAWLVELVLAGQLAQHVAALKVTQADLSGKQPAGGMNQKSHIQAEPWILSRNLSNTTKK